jgi:hypothetical protein
VFTVASVGAAVAQPAFAGSGSTDVPEPFSIHSGDTCRMGVAEGTIVWHLPPAGRTVDGKVTVADRPVPNDPAPGCRDDGRLTVLSVIGRVSGRPADQVLLEADNGQREYAFTLTATVRIEEVVVLVCRRTRARAAGLLRRGPDPPRAGHHHRLTGRRGASVRVPTPSGTEAPLCCPQRTPPVMLDRDRSGLDDIAGKRWHVDRGRGFVQAGRRPRRAAGRCARPL